MDLSWWHLALAALAGLAGGAVNSLAGGGTLITFPALTALGIPPLQANMTNTVALIPGYFSGSVAQRAAILDQRHQVYIAFPVAALGGLVGGWLLLQTDAATFESLVPWLILAASLLLAVESRLKAAVVRLSARRGAPAASHLGNDLALAAMVFLGALYGGFFGAGLGIVVLALMGLVMSETLSRINAVKQTVSLAANVTAALVFSGSGMVEWKAAVALGIGAFIGGECGGYFASSVKPELLRIVVVLLGVGISIAFFLKHN
jgi:uncharacterized membrane protein YfcA